MLVPPSCAGCGWPGAVMCESCAAHVEPAPVLDPPDGLDACLALVSYDGVGRELVIALKYRNARALVTNLTAALSELVAVELVDQPAIDAVTWAPTSAARRHRRGFDQAQLLARGVGRRARLPVRRLLTRPDGSPQTGRSRDERLAGPPFIARRSPATVLVVDDVVTSGATMTAAARALRHAGASTVVGLAVARTPMIHPRAEGRAAPDLSMPSMHTTGAVPRIDQSKQSDWLTQGPRPDGRSSDHHRRFSTNRG